MEDHIQVNLKIIKCMVEDTLDGLMVKNIKVIFNY